MALENFRFDGLFGLRRDFKAASFDTYAGEVGISRVLLVRGFVMVMINPKYRIFDRPVREPVVIGENRTRNVRPASFASR